MSEHRDKDAFWGRKDVRGAIAIGYVGLAALVFWPASSTGDTPAHSAPPAAAAIAAAQPAAAPAAATAASKAADLPAPAKAAAEAKPASASAEPIKVAAAPAAPVDPKAEAEAKAAIAALANIKDYHAAQWHPLHFKPAIESATNEQCLACHQEVLSTKVRETSPAGVKAEQSTAWYQTLDTYSGAQDTFHARHMSSPFAKTVMNLKCTFCHQGNDPREEAPGASATAAAGNFTLRKVVNPSTSCLMCHGKFPGQVMGFDTQPWHALREGLETPDAPNGCLSCHAEQFRTVRHKVNYLNADAIETEAKAKSDTCFGCHGGRAWYRNSYPYPRHDWPGMDPAVPDWAKDRPKQSAPEHIVGVK